MESLNLPEQSGVILLSNAVTFPYGLLPLHIFESRYRDMLDDAFKENSMICVANLNSEETANLEKCTSKIGFIGSITASEKQEDGCSNLILQSLSRVEFVSWEDGFSYPKAKIKLIRDKLNSEDESNALVIMSLRDATTRFLNRFDNRIIDQVNSALDRIKDNLGTLTDVIAQQFISDAGSRQLLFEETNAKLRAEFLIRHLRKLANE